MIAMQWSGVSGDDQDVQSLGLPIPTLRIRHSHYDATHENELEQNKHHAFSIQDLQCLALQAEQDALTMCSLDLDHWMRNESAVAVEEILSKLPSLLVRLL
jgi:hypothetical protein